MQTYDKDLFLLEFIILNFDPPPRNFRSAETNVSLNTFNATVHSVKQPWA